ncbi:hypothetical protein TSUD_369240 [Trifolium subterraneum]|uniref:F-box domain-containing protein n=1 Tax=Trifolium subterraneum TaxID=3900 RepID=A0A2Z6NSI6_TRISU|nr:hypothetical protein TSUD_369240 [Trifolium subterraneum]
MASEEEENNDRMSSLPDSILSRILSFLPTKTSVRMSFVSRRWRNFWKNLQVFDFSDKSSYVLYDHDNEEQFLLFTIFVNAVLTLRRSLVIRKFSLDCYHIQDDPFWTYSVDTWISTAIGPHLEEFHLTLLTTGFNNLPLKLLSCSNLVPQSQWLYLVAIARHFGNLLTVAEGVAPTRHVPSSLKWLKVKVENEVGTCLEIDVPGLKYLSLTKVILGDVVRNLHNVEEAYLDVFSTPESKSVEPIYILLRALSGIKRLELHESTIKGDRSFDSSPSYRREAKPEKVPKCLGFHLTFINFQGYIGNELEFIMHVLQNGLVLKTMIAEDYWFDSIDQVDEWSKKISDLPRGSAMCEVKSFY